MGGGKEKQKTNQLLEQQQRTASQEHSDVMERSAPAREEAYGRAGDTRGQLSSLFARGPSMVNYDQARSRYQPFMSSGGIDPTAMRAGQDTMSEFSRTGGISDTDKMNLRARASSVIPAYYKQMEDDALRQRTLSGGYGPGFEATRTKRARDMTRNSAEAAREAELGILDRVTSGRQWGAGALSDSEARVQQAIQQGLMFGAGGLAGLDEGEQNWNASANNTWNMANADMLGSLYGQDIGQGQYYEDLPLRSSSLLNDAYNSVVQGRVQNNPQRDWLGTVMGLAGATGGAMTGLGALGVGRRAYV